MPDISVFCEDSFHEKFIGALLKRLEFEMDVAVESRFLSSLGGLPRMHGEFRTFLRDLERAQQPRPDSIIVVLDGNCLGYNDRKQTMERPLEHYPQFRDLVIYAIPDPHIERWMLVDPEAFQAVFGRGCTLPALKCAKDEYKKLLQKEIHESGREPLLGGLEFAEDIVARMNLAQAEAREPSLGLFLRALRARFQQWRNS